MLSRPVGVAGARAAPDWGMEATRTWQELAICKAADFPELDLGPVSSLRCFPCVCGSGSLYQDEVSPHQSPRTQVRRAAWVWTSWLEKAQEQGKESESGATPNTTRFQS